MKIIGKILKWTGIVIGSLVIILAITVMLRQDRKFDAPYPEVTASKDSAVIARGKALVYGPAHCALCHTTNDMLDSVDQGAIVPMAGGHIFDIPIGKLYSRNLTSDKETGIGNLTDKEIARTLRYGVGSDGRALLDLMPFQHLSEEDMVAIISYLRTQEPVKNQIPKNEYNTLGKIVSAFLIKPTFPSQEVPKKVYPAPTAEYGKYLAHNVANCRGCHTDRDLRTGAYIGKDFAGGLKMEAEGAPGTFLTSPNITPDPETGRITTWTLPQFIERFRKGKLIKLSHMPWGPFSRMSDMELEAIYKYIKTLEPVKNEVGPVLTTAEK